MPGFDGKGPEGKGSMTGRGFGRCKDDRELRSPIFGRGRGSGRGFGRGQGCGYRPYHGRGFGRFGLAYDPTDPESNNKSE